MAMLAVMRRRDFAVLWAAAALSMLGTWVRFAALPLYVYETTGSALATGAMFVSSALPMLLLGSVAGVFADEYRGRVWGAFMTNLAIFALVGRVFVMLLGDALGALHLLAAVALFDTLAGVLAIALLRSNHRRAPARPAAIQAEATVVG
jgi:MFS family permease